MRYPYLRRQNLPPTINKIHLLNIQLLKHILGVIDHALANVNSVPRRVLELLDQAEELVQGHHCVQRPWWLAWSLFLVGPLRGGFA